MLDLLRFCLFTLSIPFLLASCELDPAGSPELTLPPISCEKKQTYGCLIDGEVFRPNSLSVVPMIAEYYYFNYNGYPLSGTLTIDGNSDSPRRLIRISLKNQVMDTGTYYLGIDSTKHGTVRYSLNSRTYYYCRSGMYGELHVSGIDTIQRIICGTFGFDAVNKDDDQDTVKIRDGRFDLEFFY